MSRIENAEIAPTIATLVRMAAALDVKIATLFRPAAKANQGRGRLKRSVGRRALHLVRLVRAGIARPVRNSEFSLPAKGGRGGSKSASFPMGQRIGQAIEVVQL